MQPRAGRIFPTGLEQGDAVMVRVQPQEHGPAGHHVVLVDVGNAEAKHLRVETGRTLDVGDIQRDMADLAEAERQARGTVQSGDRLYGGVCIHRWLLHFGRG